MKKALLLFFVTAMIFACSPKEQIAEKQTETKNEVATELPIMPDFTLIDSEGNNVNLYEKLDAGNTVIVDFWALWCVPCIKLLPHLSSYQDKYDNLEVLAISEDSKRQSAKAGKFAKEKGWNVTTLYDPSGEVKELLGVTVIPETFYVTPDRKIHYHHFGFENGGEVEMEEVLIEVLESVK